jgi:hypothetical protein
VPEPVAAPVVEAEPADSERRSDEYAEPTEPESPESEPEPQSEPEGGEA